jgi:hypothetical protein
MPARTKRQNALDLIRLAAYNGHDHIAARHYVENRISYEAFQEAVALGRRQRETADAQAI